MEQSMLKIESTWLVTSLHLVQARMVKSKHAQKVQQEKIFVCTLNKGLLPTLSM